ncbi:MAG: M20/M25/M40 family metallo-hydrolase [Acidobacteriota bacterium]
MTRLRAFHKVEAMTAQGITSRWQLRTAVGVVVAMALAASARGSQAPDRPAAAGAALEAIDSAAVAKIRDEALNRSHVMDTVFWLSDRYGPRLNGSPEFEEAGDWAIKQMQAWGVANVHKERFPSGHGWSLVRFHATMTEPRVMPIIGLPKAWTPGLHGGTVIADVVRPVIANEPDAARYKGKLRGKIVLTQTARGVRMLEQGDGTVLRYADKDGKWIREAMTPPPPRAAVPTSAPAAAAPTVSATATAAASRGATPRFNLMQFYKDEGVIAVFDRGPDSDLSAGGSDLSWLQQRVDGGTFVVMEGASARADPASTLPQVTLAVEHYNRMVRLLAHDVPVKVELNIEAHFSQDTGANGFNIIGEIPGTDKADEIVLLGAHFDSWHGATGATDNASGSAAMMEVLRILKATGLRPRRTIRIGLWGSEESGQWNGLETGLIGSQTYARDHLGTRETPKPELAKLAAYFNLDNGTGPIRGVWTMRNPAVMPIFEAWSEAVTDLGVALISPRDVSQTDHVSFDRLGVPAFQFVQERYEYNSRTHHTNMDVYDRIQPDDLKQVAAVAAIFAWQAATRDEMLPRRPAAPAR